MRILEDHLHARPDVAQLAVVEEATTEAAGGSLVARTSVIGVLTPYSAGGADLFLEGSVEAHWYQWGRRARCSALRLSLGRNGVRLLAINL